ncbi:MAG TPA: DUF3592 domain-containing protein [Anaerolineae bacterium]|nr:DUF3592 domain-containing protein [Anaerolineae bacterium]
MIIRIMLLLGCWVVVVGSLWAILTRQIVFDMSRWWRQGEFWVLVGIVGVGLWWLISALGLLGIGFVLGGCFFIREGWEVWEWMEDSEDWPQVEGKVILSELEQVRDAYGFKHTPNIEVEYKVDGNVYKTKELSLMPRPKSNSWRKVDKRLAPYREGAMVGVYHHPNTPEVAVLEVVKPAWWRSVPLRIGAGMWFFGGSLLAVDLYMVCMRVVVGVMGYWG